MSTGSSTNPTLGQADTLFAAETPPSPVDAGGGDVTELFDDPRYSGGALLGQGGMGEVRLLRDRRLGREVAVKVLRPGMGSVGARRRRFIREARVQGQVEHPSVVPVYDLEMDSEGEARITMKRVRGVTMEAALSGLAAGDATLARRFPRRRLLTAFVSVCRALEFAHARGVVHRDVKPANVMLGDFGEVHLLDWGIARIQGSSEAPDADVAVAFPDPTTAETLSLSDPTPVPAAPRAAPPNRASASAQGGLSPGPERGGPPSSPERKWQSSDPHGTAMGALLGTPGYMSPEQASGRTDLIDARTDVYALGAMLFEILTLTPMISGRTAQEKLAAARDTARIHSPAAAAPEADVPPELDEAVRRATAANIEDRYPGAGALAEAVDRYLDGDRDLAARRALATVEVERARESLRASEDSPEQAELRASAVRALARAVALDPQHREASELLGTLLVETPRELPKEAAKELAAARGAAATTAARIGVLRMGGVVVLSILGLLMGVRIGWLAALGVGALAVSAALSSLWIRAGSERARAIARGGSLAGSITAITVLSYALGPSILVPALCMVNGLVLLAQDDFRSPRLVVGASLIPVLWRFAAGLLGSGAPPYEVTLDRVVIPATLVSFPPGWTLFLLAITGVGTVAVPLVAVTVLRDRLRSLEERLFLHSHHLRRLASSSPEERA